MLVTDIAVKGLFTLDFATDYSDYYELAAVSDDTIIGDFGALLRKKHGAVGAGIGPHRIYGVAISMITEDVENKKTYDNALKEFFLKTFQPENVISLKGKVEGNSTRHLALIYPLNMRMLHPEMWFNIVQATNHFSFQEELLVKLANHVEQMTGSDFTYAPGVGPQRKDRSKSIAEIDLISGKEYAPIKETDYQEVIYDARGYERQERTDLPFERFNQILQGTIEYFTVGVEKGLYIRAQRGDITPNDYMTEVGNYLKRQYPDMTENDFEMIQRKIYSAVYGYYVLESLINSPDISDIKVYGPKRIRVKANGRRMTSNQNFLNSDDYARFINSLGIRYRINFAEEAIAVRTDNFTNPNYILRINLTSPQINSSGNFILHIRKTRKTKMTPEELIEKGAMTWDIYHYLRERINSGSMLFCGRGGSGKTTMMNTLIEAINYNSSGLVMQESEELFDGGHPDFAYQHIAGRYNLEEEAKNGLRIDLDYFIIGEILGAEATMFLRAETTGTYCIASVHSSNCAGAIDTLSNYITQNSKYSKEEAVYLLKEIGTIVHMDHFRVNEICLVDHYDMDKKELVLKTVYKL